MAPVSEASKAERAATREAAKVAKATAAEVSRNANTWTASSAPTKERQLTFMIIGRCVWTSVSYMWKS
jgi:hypothetical protein